MKPLKPNTIADVYLKDSARKTINNFIKSGSNGNFLFYGDQGTGKTTTALALCEDINAEYLLINASSDNGIDTIRETITRFCQSKSIDGRRKVVIFDESDSLTKVAQKALRALMNIYNNVSYFFTCNYVENIIVPLIDRCQSIEFTIPNGDEILEYIIKYLDDNSIIYDIDELKSFLLTNHISIRSLVNHINVNITDNILTLGSKVDDDTILNELLTLDSPYDFIRKFPLMPTNTIVRILTEHYLNHPIEGVFDVLLEFSTKYKNIDNRLLNVVFLDKLRELKKRSYVL